MDKITTHTQDALKRLLFQYKGSTNLRNMITILIGDQVQNLEDAIFSLYGRLDIDGSSGIQLDRIGTIVGQERLGLADAEYQLFIKAKIAVNVSEGDAERIISTWKLMTGADQVVLYEAFPAEVDLYTESSILTPSLEPLALELIQNVAAGGVRVGFAAVYDPDNAFSFALGGLNTGGFGTTSDPGVGGKLSTIIGV